MSGKKHKRKQNYIDSHVQGSLLRRICFHWIIFFVVAAASIILLQTLLGDPSKSLVERMQQEATEFTFMGIVMLSLFPAFMLDTIRFSNRFVGPIARVKRHLRQLSEGDTTKCSFRDNDFWADLADDFNKAAELVEKQKVEIEELKGKLELQAQ